MTKFILLLTLALSTSSAFSDEIPAFTVADIQPEPALENRSLLHALALEVSGSILGGYGMSYENSANSNQIATTELMAAAQARYYLSPHVALGTSVGFGSGIAEQSAYTASGAPNYSQHAYPALVGLRYQFASLAGNPKMKPYVELESGIAFVRQNALPNLNLFTINTEIAARGTIGFDFFLSAGQRTYIGYKLAYLALNKFSNVQNTLALGYAF